MKKNKYTPGSHQNWDVYSKIMNRIRFNYSDRILDAGCGNGKLGKHLHVILLYAIDLNKESLKKLNPKVYDKKICCDLAKIPFKDNYFDKTFCIEVFHYLKDRKKVFEELRRVTKGELIIAVPNYNTIGLRSILSKKLRMEFMSSLNKNHFPMNEESLRELGDCEIFYVSARWGFIRNLFGDRFASEVVGIYKSK